MSVPLLTNHAQVLLCVGIDPEARIRDIAAQVEITERQTQRIVSQLVEAGYLSRRRVGRRNVYKVNREQRIEHPAWGTVRLGELLTSGEAGAKASSNGTGSRTERG